MRVYVCACPCVFVSNPQRAGSLDFSSILLISWTHTVESESQLTRLLSFFSYALGTHIHPKLRIISLALCPFNVPHLLVPYKIKIFIKTLTGRKQGFNFEPENEVLAVKQALQEKEGIQVDQIRLIYSGKQLYVQRVHIFRLSHC